MVIKKILSIFTAAIIISLIAFGSLACEEQTATTDTSASKFKDIDSTHWASDAITLMTEMGVISGYPDGSFKPDNQVTREEFAKIMVAALGLPIKTPDIATFKDVSKDSWSFRFVETAKPYLTGFRTTLGDFFKPSSPAEREDMAVALVKALQYDNETVDESTLDVFSDRDDMSSNLKKFIAIAIKHNLMSGYPIVNSQLKAFKPRNSLTRAEAAKLLYNVIKAEKVTYGGEEKVTYDSSTQNNTSTPSSSATPMPTPKPSSSEFSVPQVSGRLDGGKIILSWQHINDNRLSGYKVVVSKYNQAPKYPDDGYLYWITEKSRNYAVVDNHEPYKSGDFGKYLVPGEEYYFSITAIYGDKSVPGNVIKMTFPSSK